MAEIVDKMPKSRAARPCLYPWQDWFDGRIWKLTKGTDFKHEATAFRLQVIVRASDFGQKVTTRVVGDDVYVQAKPSTNGTH